MKPKLLAINQKALIGLAIAAAWIAAPLSTLSDWLTEPPLDAPITLAPASSLTRTITIHSPETFGISLIFKRQGHPFGELKRLIGSMGLCPPPEVCSQGIPVTMTWSLTDPVTQQTIAAGTTRTLDSQGWAADEVQRRVGRFYATPGHYRFHARILSPTPELARFQTNLRIAIPPKGPYSTLLGLVWLAILGQVLIAYPLGAVTLYFVLRTALTPDKD